jgi:ribosomal protein S18 acetylase RimI-like enzyme
MQEMIIKIKKATNSNEFKIIEKLATEIYHEVYDKVIPPEHTDYFLKSFQSENAISKQIKNENFSYFLLNIGNTTAGYFGLQKLDKKLILSKLYILKLFRGFNLGNKAIEHVTQLAVDHGFFKIVLVVNQQNQKAILFYKKNGFKIIESVKKSFPNGHSVEDYKMEKRIMLH